MTTPDSKQQVRARFRAEGALPGDAAASARISESLLELPEVGFATGVLGYLAIVGEPNIDAVLESLLARGARPGVPMVDWASGSMEAGVFGGCEGLSCHRYGVREPVAGTSIVPIGELRVVLVPGVAFDLRGGRLGRGGGFYDRFLARLGPQTIRVGVGFERRVVDRLPVEPWDQSVDVLVTEQAVRRFERLPG
ncbi:MAG: 5-formyltetrahydrofolate cyclo-ligase [Leptolyngbya sp. PLA3]|nr:MAG: 5-formyltetrahydrofolate cyclo-ligase [Cyanobacteria bacterium CYA]MCE7967989.1 5-formyltetrahydrofolate cyclo-ligase [Leptolyngbya sp. PL-A3]